MVVPQGKKGKSCTLGWESPMAVVNDIRLYSFLTGAVWSEWGCKVDYIIYSGETVPDQIGCINEKEPGFFIFTD